METRSKKLIPLKNFRERRLCFLQQFLSFYLYTQNHLLLKKKNFYLFLSFERKGEKEAKRYLSFTNSFQSQARPNGRAQRLPSGQYPNHRRLPPKACVRKLSSNFNSGTPMCDTAVSQTLSKLLIQKPALGSSFQSIFPTYLKRYIWDPACDTVR